MGVGEQRSTSSPTSSPSPATASGSSYFGRRTDGSPVSLLVLLHTAFRRELKELKRLVVCGGGGGGGGREMVVELKKRVEFFSSVYKYHCAAEAEVIFVALDGRVENIACTYYLQHSSADSMFISIMSCLSGLVNDLGNSSEELQEVIFQIGTLQDSICQHMVKEEKQVFPLLMSHFSDEEQASLVWQFICSFPVMLLEDLLPWLASLLSSDEQLNLKDCINNILTEDKSTLQEMLISWIDKAAQRPQDDCDEKDRSFWCPQEQDNLREMSNLCLLRNSSNGQEDLQKVFENGPFGGLLLWHSAIRSDFKDILNKLSQARLQKFPSLISVIVQIKFLNEVLIFYSNILEKNIYPLLQDTYLLQPFPHKDEVGVLQGILYDANHINMTEPTFLENLCGKVESLVLVTTEHLSFHETEVFPLISGICSHESQQKLLSRSIRMLPLGLLKCVVTWFSLHLPKDELKSILHGIEQCCFLDKSFASLLHEWVRSGYSGKTSTENLQEMFDRRAPFKFEFSRGDTYSCENLKHASLSFVGSSSIIFPQSTSTSGGMFSSQATNLSDSPYGHPIEAVSNNFREPRPMDHIYYFHKAIKKDLESLVVDATKLSKNVGLLMEFTQHFVFVRSLYELHSETEDKIAFPALERNPNARNITQSYSLDHEMEAECFERVSGILDEMSALYHTLSLADGNPVDLALVKYQQLCLELEDSCKSMKKTLEDHILREETELWPLFREYFSIEEQEKILGYMLGRTRAEILQEMIVWLMAYLTVEEQQAMVNYWRKATCCTKFDEWLGEWWEGVNKYDFGKADESRMRPSAIESVNVASKRLSSGESHDWKENMNAENFELLIDDAKTANMAKKMEGLDVDSQRHKLSEYTRVFEEMKEKRRKEEDFNIEHSQFLKPIHEEQQQTKHKVTSEAELAVATKRVPQGSSLDLHANSRPTQNSTTSHCLEAKLHPDSDNVTTSKSGILQGQIPSYRDTEGSVFGCKHYKRNCKLVASCCNRLSTCRLCHDEEIPEHVMDRKSTTQMMCMKCLEVQPIGRTCSTPSCNGYSMARYYCRICKFFDDERPIYHCPYCNLCRLGKGLGVDYFHCMKCNACMGLSLRVHTCIEKCIEDKCPICQEDMFTSTNPVKSLSCGHVMHSTCFQDYTCMHYTCPICSKSLGDMQVYFEMLDALLAEEKMPEEYRGQTQAILCNDCEKKGTALKHFLYHKCPFCGSYNTRRI